MTTTLVLDFHEPGDDRRDGDEQCERWLEEGEKGKAQRRQREHLRHVEERLETGKVEQHRERHDVNRNPWSVIRDR